METYLGLVTQTYQEPDEPPAVGTEGAAGVDGLQVLIDTHINNLAVYSTKVIDIRTNNIETFRSNKTCIAATKFHFRPRLKFQFITDVRSSQFRLVVRGDNIVNIICYLSLICSISFRALLSLSSNQSSAVSSESAPILEINLLSKKS